MTTKFRHGIIGTDDIDSRMIVPNLIWFLFIYQTWTEFILNLFGHRRFSIFFLNSWKKDSKQTVDFTNEINHVNTYSGQPRKFQKVLCKTLEIIKKNILSISPKLESISKKNSMKLIHWTSCSLSSDFFNLLAFYCVKQTLRFHENNTQTNLWSWTLTKNKNGHYLNLT